MTVPQWPRIRVELHNPHLFHPSRWKAETRHRGEFYVEFRMTRRAAIRALRRRVKSVTHLTVPQ